MTQDFKQWWDAWWEEDYSWEGLGKLNPDGTPHKPWRGWCILEDYQIVEDPSSWPEGDDRRAPRPPGARPATLQDYWRRTFTQNGLDPENQLEQSPCSGKHFTAVHRPLRWENGQPAIIVDQSKLLSYCLADQQPGRFDENTGDPIGPDQRTHLDGAVISSSSAVIVGEGISTICISAKWTHFFGGYSFDGLHFLGCANFDHACFSGIASFRGAAFLNIAFFTGAVFGSDAIFDAAIFCSNARFDKTAFISDVLFNGAIFIGDSWFNSAAFCKMIEFQSSIFCSRSRFDGEGAALVRQPRKSYIEPVPTSLVNSVRFEFQSPLDLFDLSERSFKKAAFDKAIFLDTAFFDNRDIHEASSFDHALFFKEARFHGAGLHQGISFLDTAFEAGLSRMRQFVVGAGGDNSFLVPEWALRRLYAVAIRSSEIKGEDPISYAAWWNDFDEKRAKDAADFRALPQKAPDNSSASSKGAYYAKLEDAFRTLKQAMEANRDRQGEARFFRLELLARRKKLDLPRQWGEWLLSGLYEAVSDFGNSVWRPLIWLLGLWVVMAVVYAPTATFPVRFPKLTEVGEALSFSGGRIVPFGPWAGDPSACSVGGRLLSLHPTAVELEAEEACKSDLKNAYGSGTAFGVSVLATLQSAFALILIFLSGVAARRRFQIN